MKLPFGYVLVGEKIVVHKENADVVRNIFEYYPAGASLEEIVDALFVKGISSPNRKLKTGSSSCEHPIECNIFPIVSMLRYQSSSLKMK